MSDLQNVSTADLETLSLAELKSLQKKIAKAISSFEDRQRAAALAALEAKAKEMGFSLAELTGASAKVAKAKGVPKYANPENPAQTWTGKGRRPDWFIAAIDAGKTPEDLAL
jgi:DNA-binding protein H-NS